MSMNMSVLLNVTASNVAVAAVLAVFAWSAGRRLRRPALTHALWLLVVVKLLTPPLVPVTVWRTTATADVVAPVVAAVVTTQRTPAAPDSAPTAAAVPIDVDALDVGIDRFPPEGVVADEPPPARFFEPGLNEGALIAGDVGQVSNLPEEPSTLATFSMVIAILWLAGSVLWLVVALRRLLGFQKLLCHAEPAPADIVAVAEQLASCIGVRCPPIVMMPGTITPLVWCLAGKPRLVVPAALVNRLDSEQWRTLLAHELAHLRRRDHWVRWLEFAALAVYWWCPLAWWARQQLQQAEEECCDAWVVWALPEAGRTYAAALVETIDFLSGARPVLPVAASGLGHLHLLKRRLTMILRGTTPRALSAGGLAMVLGMGAALLPLMPTWAQEPPAAGQREAPPARVERGGGSQDPKPRPTPARTQPREAPDNRDELQGELNRMQREMAELQEQIAQKQRRIAELAKRLGTPRPDDAARPRAAPNVPPPLQPLPPQPAQPRYSVPGRNNPLAAVPMIPPPGNLERRIENLERKLDAVLRQLEGRYPPATGNSYGYPPGSAAQPRPPAQPRQPAPPRPVPGADAPGELPTTPRVPPPPPDRRPDGADNLPGQPPAPVPTGPVGLPPTAVVPAP